MTAKISHMLMEAYAQLGILQVKDMESRAKEAVRYLLQDREHYIEVGEPDTPEYLISTPQGVICHMVPLARKVIREQREHCVKEQTYVLSLMATENTVRYVSSLFLATLYPDAADNTFRFPIYRYVQLADFPKDLEVLPPRQIRPIATTPQREALGMVFMAIAKFSKNLDINMIPHKTERALLAAEHAPKTQLTIDGRSLCGKLIPLATENSLWDEMREDHRYSYSRKLCILLTEENPRYVLKTHHIYNYFRKIIYDDEPGGCAYEPTEQKQESTYQYVCLEDVPQTLHPLYN